MESAVGVVLRDIDSTLTGLVELDEAARRVSADLALAVELATNTAPPAAPVDPATHPVAAHVLGVTLGLAEAGLSGDTACEDARKAMAAQLASTLATWDAEVADWRVRVDQQAVTLAQLGGGVLTRTAKLFSAAGAYGAANTAEVHQIARAMAAWPGLREQHAKLAAAGMTATTLGQRLGTGITWVIQHQAPAATAGA